MKRIGCIVIAVLFLALGITATIRDYQKTSQQANKIKDYPVIKASELLLESDSANYIVGDKESYYKLIDQSFVWDSFVFLFFGIGLAGVFLFLAYRWD